jgi:DNA polymerase-3 subunit gamma/tau
VTATDSARLQAQAAAVGTAALIRTIDELATALTAVREGDDARMAVEIALLKAARPDLDPSTEGLLRRIERLEGQLRDGGGTPAGPVAAAPPTVLGGGAAPAPRGTPATPPPAAEAPPADDPEPASEAPISSPHEPHAVAEDPVPSASPAPEPAASDEGAAATGPAGQGDLDLEKLKQMWPAILDQLATTAPALAAFFEEARPVGFEAAESVVEISFPAAATFNKRKAETPENRERVAESLATVTGQSLKPTYVLLDGESEAPVEAPAAPQADEGLDEEELLERLKSEFDAEEVS